MSLNIFLDYDINKNNTQEKFGHAHYIKFKRSNNTYDSDHILFFDIEKKLIATHQFEINGILIHKYNTWIWSWAMPFIQHKLINYSRKILNYGLDMGTEINDIRKIFFITSRFKIPNQFHVDYINAMSLELIKNQMIFQLQLKISDEIIKKHKFKNLNTISFDSYFQNDIFIEISDNNIIDNKSCISYYLFLNK